MLDVLARSVALFLGAFGLANLALGLVQPHADASVWWLDPRPLSGAPAALLLAAISIALLTSAVGAPPGAWRMAARAGVGIALLVALANAARCLRLAARGEIALGLGVPVSAVLAALLALVLTRLPRTVPGGAPLAVPAAGALGCAAAFALLQMLAFGRTDYRRSADAVVVLGAKVHADGRVSHALGDRVRTACELVRQGLARTLVLSGGPGEGAVHETEGMRRMAIGLGVPESAIVADAGGTNTRGTVAGTARLFRERGIRRALVVSHAYHLPRVKMAYQRAGIEVRTVPARESYLLTAMPWYMAREVVAFWVYWVRPRPASARQQA